jgi:hypothetical protein
MNNLVGHQIQPILYFEILKITVQNSNTSFIPCNTRASNKINFLQLIHNMISN